MAFLTGTYIISFYFQNNLWSHFSDHISFIDENLTKVMQLPMLLTITLKITVITSGHQKDILTLSPKCLNPVSVFTLSSIGAEHKKLLVLEKRLSVLLFSLFLCHSIQDQGHCAEYVALQSLSIHDHKL